MKLLAGLFALLGSFATSAPAAPGADPGSIVAAVAREALEKGPVPGLSVAVLQDDRIAYAGGFGEAEIDNHVPATAATIYRINSITKAFTAVVVLQLVEQGKLRLDDHLAQYLPDFTRPGRDPTLRQLLNHSSGLVDYGASFRKNIRLDLDAHQWAESVNDEHLYAFEPGRDWSYSNLGYDLLGLIVARVSGTPFADYLQAHVFAPTGMAATRMCNTPQVVPDRAYSYVRDGGTWRHADSWGTYGDASGRICSNVRDLAAFWGALESGKLISAASLKTMRERGRLGNGASFGYGLGTRLGQLAGHALIAHTGSGESWSSALLDLPERRLAVIVLTNSDAAARPARRIAAAILRRAAGIPEAAVRDRPVEPALSRALVGVWGARDPAQISAAGTHIAFKPVGAPMDPVPLVYLGHGMFRFPDNSPAPGLIVAFDVLHRPNSVEAFTDGVFEALHMKQSP